MSGLRLLSSPKCWRCCCVVFLTFIVIEVVIFNLVLYSGYVYLQQTYNLFSSQDPSGISFFDKLLKTPVIRKILHEGKMGGVASLLDETVDRVFLVSHHNPQNNSGKVTFPSLNIQDLHIDVSHSGEISYLLKRIYSRKTFPYKLLVVDIGANDGLFGSNSYNFIKLGWDALLVEPQADQLANARINLDKYLQINVEKSQNIEFVQAVVSDVDGEVNFVMTDDAQSMESHVLTSLDDNESKLGMTKVKSITVNSLVTRYNIPKMFAVLSIDAEGFGDKILWQWMDLGYTPAYIIYEAINNKEPPQVTVDKIKKYHYRFIEKRGYNYILEHIPNR